MCSGLMLFRAALNFNLLGRGIISSGHLLFFSYFFFPRLDSFILIECWCYSPAQLARGVATVVYHLDFTWKISAAKPQRARHEKFVKEDGRTHLGGFVLSSSPVVVVGRHANREREREMRKTRMRRKEFRNLGIGASHSLLRSSLEHDSLFRSSCDGH